MADLQELGLDTLSLDVTLQESIDDVKDQVEKRTGGKLDCLVNNAGRSYTMPAVDVDFQEVYATFEANFFGVMRMCQTFAPLLIDAKGAIVQIGSVAAVMPFVFGSTYNASKAALQSYSDALRVELAPFGVDVITIITGGVTSRITRVERQLPPDSIYQPVSTAYQRRLAESQSGAMPNEDYARSVVSQVLAATASRDPPSYITASVSGPGFGSSDVVGDVMVQAQLILNSLGTAMKSRVLSLFGVRTGVVPTDHIWAGAMASTVWIVNTFMPRGTWDVIYSKMYDLHKLHRPSGLASGSIEDETMDVKKDL